MIRINLLPVRKTQQQMQIRNQLMGAGAALAVVLLGCIIWDISLSSEILPQIREYYRMSTTLVNAYLVPVMLCYLQKLGQKLKEKGIDTPQCYAMQSNGGVSTFARAGQEAVTTILSGPAASVVGA